MTLIPRARYAPPIASPRKATRTLTIPVQGGVHLGLPAQDLPLGFASDARNFVNGRDGTITPRSGLSQPSTHDFGGAVLGAAEVFDIEGRSAAFAPSTRSLSFFHPSDDAWSYLSYVPGTVASAMTDGAVSGTSRNYFRAVSVYDQTLQETICVFSNGTNAIKFFPVVAGASPNTYSDFTFVDSLDSMKKAKDVTAVNDRLVFVNTEKADGERFPTRVYWSARGDPRNYDLNSEAGFEDLMEMRGEIQAAVRFRDFLILFSEHEVWRATPTLDAYAFRFDRIADNIGCPYPKTAVATPVGIMFVGADLEVYITDGASVFAVGPTEVGAPSRIQPILRDEATTLERMWAVYGRDERRYELYYATGVSDLSFVQQDSEGYPSRALFYHLDSRTWWPQRFSHELSSGVDVDDPDTNVVYDDVDLTYDEVASVYDDFTFDVDTRAVNVFASDGTGFKFISTQTSDDGAVIDARWRSPGFHAGSTRRRHLTEVWMDYEATSASSASVFVGNVRNSASFDDGVAVSLTSSGDPVFVPTWETATAPAFEVRITDGGRPRIASFSATLKDASKF